MGETQKKKGLNQCFGSNSQIDGSSSFQGNSVQMLKHENSFMEEHLEGLQNRLESNIRIDIKGEVTEA